MIKKCIHDGWVTYYDYSSSWLLGIETYTPLYSKPYNSYFDLLPYDATITNIGLYEFSDEIEIHIMDSGDSYDYWDTVFIFDL